MRRLLVSALLVLFFIPLAFAEEIVPAAVEAAPEEAKTEIVEVVDPQPKVEEKDISEEAPVDEGSPQKSEDTKPDAA